MIDPRALKELVLTRVRVMLREPEVLFWIFVFPIVVALGLGIAFSDPSPHGLRVAVEPGSPGERYSAALEATPELEVRILDPEAAADALRRGEVEVVLSGGGAAGSGTVVFRYDPTRSEGRTARLVSEGVLQEAAGASRPVAVREEEVRARGHRYIDWLIPGLIGFNLMGTGLWGVGFYIAQARQNRELRRLITTPMRKSDFLLAQILSRFAFLIVEVPLIILFAWLAFGVTVEGGALSLALVILAGAACFAVMGLLAASRVRTTEAIGGIINAIMMPMLVLSGVFFSTTRFPEAAQPFIQVLPLTALNTAVRAVYNDGLPVTAAAGELLILALWTVGSFVVALRLFRWQ